MVPFLDRGSHGLDCRPASASSGCLTATVRGSVPVASVLWSHLSTGGARCARAAHGGGVHRPEGHDDGGVLLQAEHKPQTEFHFAQDCAWYRPEALCEKGAVDRDNLGHVDDGILG